MVIFCHFGTWQPRSPITFIILKGVASAFFSISPFFKRIKPFRFATIIYVSVQFWMNYSFKIKEGTLLLDVVLVPTIYTHDQRGKFLHFNGNSSSFIVLLGMVLLISSLLFIQWRHQCPARLQTLWIRSWRTLGKEMPPEGWWGCVCPHRRCRVTREAIHAILVPHCKGPTLCMPISLGDTSSHLKWIHAYDTRLSVHTYVYIHLVRTDGNETSS